MATTTSSGETSIKVVTFSGKKKDWTMWEEKFLARASHRGYKHILTDDGIDIPKSDETGLTPEKEQVKKLNEKAYMDLILSMDTDQSAGSVAFNIVKGTKKGDFKEGNARLAWKNLKKKYAPTTAPSLMRMSEMYTNAKLRKGADPDVYITYLEDLRDRLEQMDWKVTDTQFMVKVLNSLTPEYDTQVKLLEKRIDKSGNDALKLEEIREDLSLEYERFQRTRRSNKDKEESGGETALYAGGQFKGKCRGCGKYGHKVVNCPDRKDGSGNTGNRGNNNGNDSGGFKGKCFKCHEVGHKASNCPKKKSNGGGGQDDTAEVALVMMEIGDYGQFSGDSESESKRTGRDFGEEEANFGETSVFGDGEIPADFFDDWSLFGSEDDDDTSQEARVNEEQEHPVKEGLYCEMCTWHEDSMEWSHAWCSEGKDVVEVSDEEADEDDDLGSDEEPVETRYKMLEEKEAESLFKTKMKEMIEEIIIESERLKNEKVLSGYSLKSMEIYPEADWAMISGNAMDIEVALMATEAELHDESETEANEEDKESDNSSEGQWGQCAECGDKGPVGLYCFRCKDTGMIYDGPCSPPGSSQDEESQDLFEQEREEYRELWYTLFPKCGLSNEQVERIASTLWERAQEIGALYDLKEIITDSQGWMEKHDEEFPNNKLTRDERENILKGTVRALEERIIENCRQLYQVGQEETKDSALVVSDLKIDSEVALDAYVKTSKLKNVMNQNKETKRDALTKNTWIADSGASTHMGNSDEGMTDVKVIDSPVQIGNGTTLRATKIGRKHLTVVSKDGSKMNVVLEDYKYVPDLWVNLFAITKCLKNDWNIGNEGLVLHLTKGASTLRFDRVIPTHKGVIIGVEMIARNPDITNVASAPFASGKTVDVNVLHKAIGHPSEDTTRKTAAHYNLKLKNKLEPCSDCAEGKSRQKNVNKTSEVSSKIPGERLMIDISRVKKKSYGGKKFWLLVLDDCTDKAWSFFLKQKDDQVDILIAHIKELKAQYGKVVKYIRCDNAGENISLEKRCKEEGLGIQFEYTSPNSPQYNGKIERKFAGLYGRTRANLNGAKLNKGLRDLLWAECANTSTVQENVYVTKNKKISAEEQFYDKELPGWRHMRQFGEIGIVNYGSENKHKAKHLNRGRACMYLGLAKDRPKDTFRFLNLETHKVIMSRDVIWMDAVYGDYKKMPESEIARIVEVDDDDSDDEEVAVIPGNNNESESTDEEQESESSVDEDQFVTADDGDSDEETTDKSETEVLGPPDPKVSRELSKLSAYYNTGETLSRTRSGKAYGDDDENEESEDESEDDNNEIQDVAALVMERLAEPRLDSCFLEKVEFGLNAIDLNKYQQMDPDKVPPSVYRDLFTTPEKFEDAWNHPDRVATKEVARSNFKGIN